MKFYDFYYRGKLIFTAVTNNRVNAIKIFKGSVKAKYDKIIIQK